jgi:serine O-acetyltransferase
MTFRMMLADLAYDLDRYASRVHKPRVAIVLLLPGFQAVAAYRISRWLDTRSKYGCPLWWPIIVLEAIALRLVEIITGTYISPRARIGPGLLFPHFGGVIIGEGVTIGRNCDIYQGVTLGYNGAGEDDAYPTLGDRVMVAAGAKVIGRLTIGSDVLIGANAVVTRSLPDRAVATGVPARICSRRGSFDFVHYPGEAHDLERTRSLQIAQRGRYAAEFLPTGA